jgi:hypothetical protein
MCEPVSARFPRISDFKLAKKVGLERFYENLNSWLWGSFAPMGDKEYCLFEYHQGYVRFLDSIPNGFSIRVSNFTQGDGNKCRFIRVTANKSSINNLNYETILNHSSCFVRIMLLPHLDYLSESLLFELLRDPHHDIRDAANSHTEVRASAEASSEASISADTLNLIRKASRFTVMGHAAI